VKLQICAVRSRKVQVICEWGAEERVWGLDRGNNRKLEEMT